MSDSYGEMIRANLKIVLDRIRVASQNRPSAFFQNPVQLVVVSKTKPASAVIELYQAGHRDFGENYIQELIEKANDFQILSQCPEIRWHMIGHVQRNKVKKLLALSRLNCVQTIDSIDLAREFHKHLARPPSPTQEASSQSPSSNSPRTLDILLQVNTSNEPQKSGCGAGEVLGLYDKIVAECSTLRVKGHMCIGQVPDNTLDEASRDALAVKDFDTLYECRTRLLEHISQANAANATSPPAIELSMGMSHDFELAIAHGSSIIRVGSLILGDRVK